MREIEWDKKLKIQTEGRDDFHADEYHYPYEPTPYAVLERLADSGYLCQENVVVDYGCGKGRVGFFLNHVLGCRTIGIEYDENIYRKALHNLDAYLDKEKVYFVCENAECYEVKNADCFYFFNPFSVEVLKSVIGKIMRSYYEEPRHMQLFFYYPEDEYMAYLMTESDIVFVDEIECQDLFEGFNARERIMIFEIG